MADTTHDISNYSDLFPQEVSGVMPVMGKNAVMAAL